METTITIQNRELSTRVKYKKQIIMKKFYLLAAAATILTACTNNEKMTADLSYDGPVMIGFETYHEKSLKAAPDATGEISGPTNFTSAHGGFGVWGYKGTPANIGEATGTPKVVNISSTTNFTPIFENVKVWYVDEANAAYKPKGFTYQVPKYWDKEAEYIFFAYAPYNKSTTTGDAPVVSLDRTTGNITVKDIESIQDMSKNNGETGEALQYRGTGTEGAYQAADAAGVIDYLMAKYETNQKYTGTNQDAKEWTQYTSNPDLRDQTVGFTFGHMLSRIVIKLKAAETYNGVKSINVSYLAIDNMPEVKTDKAVFTQTSPTAANGTYSPNNWDGKKLQIINTDIANNANATSKNALYILKNGVGKNGETETTNADEMTTIVNPTPQPQSFYYYVAPSKADKDETAGTVEKYTLNIKYTITYVDNTTEVVTPEPIDLSGKLTEFVQNNSYKLTINVGLNQIYFTVDAVEGFTEVEEKTIEIK